VNGGTLGKILTKQIDEPSVLGGLLNYKKAPKELKDAVNFRLYDESPQLFHNDYEGAMLSEGGGAGIPRLHVDDLKHYFGNLASDIPARYKRTTGKRDIDELASFAGFDDIDQFVESIQGELGARAQSRENVQLLKERRNDPEFLAQVQKDLEAEKAMYSPDPEPFEPSKRDLQWYIKNVAIPKSKVTQIEVKAPQQDGMKNFTINRNDIAHEVPEFAIQYIPSNHQIPVRNLSKPAAAPASPARSVLPLSKQPEQDPQGWGGLANIIMLQAATERQ
jgi:hypothetical protein